MILELGFHVSLMLESLYTFYYDVAKITFPENAYQWHHPFGGNLKFLSTQNMVQYLLLFHFIQTLYFLIAALNDVFGSNESLPSSELPFLRNLRDLYFASLAFPYGVYVTYQFWSLRCLASGGTRPLGMDNFIPRWLEHTEHTTVSILVILEMTAFFRSYPQLEIGLSIMFAYGFCYLIWLFLVQKHTGSFIYPILEDESPKRRAISFAIIFVTLLLIYLIGELMNNYIWAFQMTHLQCSSGNLRCKYTQTQN